MKSGWEEGPQLMSPWMEVAPLKATDGKGHVRPNDTSDSNKIKEYNVLSAVYLNLQRSKRN